MRISPLQVASKPCEIGVPSWEKSKHIFPRMKRGLLIRESVVRNGLPLCVGHHTKFVMNRGRRRTDENPDRDRISKKRDAEPAYHQATGVARRPAIDILIE